jgi:hypothetical protein
MVQLLFLQQLQMADLFTIQYNTPSGLKPASGTSPVSRYSAHEGFW